MAYVLEKAALCPLGAVSNSDRHNRLRHVYADLAQSTCAAVASAMRVELHGARYDATV